MKRILPALLTLAVVAPVPAPAADVAVYASARFGGTECITVVGHSLAGRTRWLTAYWQNAETRLAGGLCNEADEHVDPPIQCTEVRHDEDPYSRTITLFTYGRITNNVGYAMVLVDGTDGDAAAVARISPAPADPGPLCGAGHLAPVPVAEGTIVIAG